MRIPRPAAARTPRQSMSPGFGWSCRSPWDWGKCRAPRSNRNGRLPAVGGRLPYSMCPPSPRRGPPLDDSAAVATFLFTDIEGSTRLWEEEPERMREAMARHDTLVREAVLAHGGRVVKMTGDGLHAVFTDPLAALRASVRLQEGLSHLEATCGVPLRAR